MLKKVIKIKNGKQTEEMCESQGVKLAPASTTIEEYWYQIILDVFNYEMRREAELQEVHKLYEDKRILDGLKLYQEGKIKDVAITDVDVRANIEGEKGTYLVTLKRWRPLDKFYKPTLIRHRYQIEDYISSMFFDCSCPDHVIHHYTSNSALCCKHIAACFWLLQEKFNMPKFLIKPSELKEGYQKSNNIDLVTNLKCLPMKRFTPSINIVALKEFREVPTSLSYSIHRKPNSGYEKDYPNGIPTIWATITEPSEVEKLITANIKGYCEMLASRGNTEEEIRKAVKNLFPLTENEQVYKVIDETVDDLLKKCDKVKKKSFLTKLKEYLGWSRKKD
jgi:hypothetical protein